MINAKVFSNRGWLRNGGFMPIYIKLEFFGYVLFGIEYYFADDEQTLMIWFFNYWLDMRFPRGGKR